MSIFGKSFNADAVHAYIQATKAKEAAEKQAAQDAHKAELEKLRQSFLDRDVQADALERIAALVARQIERGEKQALLFQFPSDRLPDQGRGITSHDPEWHRKLDGFPQRAYAYFAKELAPRGFQLKVEIVDWPGGMPGDVGFYLTWKRPEEL